MVKSESQKLDLIFNALSDSTRRSILRDISRKERAVGEIAAPYQMSLAAVSKHLKVLERADLIRRRKQGSFYLVTLNPRNLKTAERWLSYYQKFWNHKLDALSSFLEDQ